MPLARADVESSLCKKGFIEERDADHRYFKLMYEGKYSGIRTKTSDGSKYKTLGDPLVAIMARQIKLDKREFFKFVECSLSQADYIQILLENNEL